jgi:hypothetical protein
MPPVIDVIRSLFRRWLFQRARKKRIVVRHLIQRERHVEKYEGAEQYPREGRRG